MKEQRKRTLILAGACLAAVLAVGAVLAVAGRGRPARTPQGASFLDEMGEIAAAFNAEQEAARALPEPARTARWDDVRRRRLEAVSALYERHGKRPPGPGQVSHSRRP